ncbi:hypothetical protein DFJ63DRAFT_206868 [Scheffersomyces coipomensis]|uniref:uncharacterized protein n=1 Tax=Scheffersomyces coipomensis TaxID=1788519 RepID=UPI00315CCF4A
MLGKPFQLTFLLLLFLSYFTTCLVSFRSSMANFLRYLSCYKEIIIIANRAYILFIETKALQHFVARTFHFLKHFPFMVSILLSHVKNTNHTYILRGNYEWKRLVTFSKANFFFFVLSTLLCS